MQDRRRFFVLLTMLAVVITTLHAETLIQGEITDLSWTEDGNPYILLDDAYVDFDNTLSVGPGVVVQGTSTAILQVYGTLLTNGVKGEGVVIFTAEDRNAPWGGIMMMTGAGSRVEMDYAVVEYAYSYDRCHGGGINCHDGVLLRLKNCIIRYNECGEDGGGIMLYNTPFDISYTFFIGNTCGRAGGGIDFAGGNDGTVHHVVFSNNHANAQGGAIYFYTSGNIVDHATLYNNTAVEPPQDARFLGGSSGFVNSIIWHEPYNGLPAFNLNNNNLARYSCVADPSVTGDSVFHLDPMFVDQDNGDFHLTEESPCIDMGDPDTQPDPDGSLPDVGRYYYGESPFNLGEIVLFLDPHHLVIPADGGYVRFDAAGVNNTDGDFTQLIFNVMVSAPNGIESGPYLDRDFDLHAHSTVWHRNFRMPVPWDAMSGRYTLAGRILQGNVILARNSFDFYKRPGERVGYVLPEEWGWDDLSTEILRGEKGSVVAARFDVLSVNPNPFNNKTNLTFELSESDHVQIRVFDIRGREVAELMNGTISSGRHIVSFDGEYLSSGIYFIQTSTNEYGSLINRVVLVK